MPSNQSLWIDEGMLLAIIHHVPIHDLPSRMTYASGSESQMPLAATFYWGAGSIVGWEEWSLRAANLVPLALGLIWLALAGDKVGAPILPLVFAVYPIT